MRRKVRGRVHPDPQQLTQPALLSNWRAFKPQSLCTGYKRGRDTQKAQQGNMLHLSCMHQARTPRTCVPRHARTHTHLNTHANRKRTPHPPFNRWPFPSKLAASQKSKNREESARRLDVALKPNMPLRAAASNPLKEKHRAAEKIHTRLPSLRVQVGGKETPSLQWGETAPCARSRCICKLRAACVLCSQHAVCSVAHRK